MGRIVLFPAAVLLLATGLIHAGGQPMVDDWLSGLSDEQKWRSAWSGSAIR